MVNKSRREYLLKSKSDINVYNQTGNKNKNGEGMINGDEIRQANTPGQNSPNSKLSVKQGFESDSFSKSNRPSEGTEKDKFRKGSYQMQIEKPSLIKKTKQLRETYKQSNSPNFGRKNKASSMYSYFSAKDEQKRRLNINKKIPQLPAFTKTKVRSRESSINYGSIYNIQNSYHMYGSQKRFPVRV